MILKKDGSVWATGGNHFGQVGAGIKENPVTDFVMVFSSGAKAVAADGGGHSMVLGKDGSVWATGRNLYGQLGDGSNDDRDTFVMVISAGVKAVAAGSKHSLVVKEDGSVWGTGCNIYGQLGEISVSATKNYLKVSYLSKVLISGADKVAAGVDHSMLLGQDGSVWTAGANYFGQLGDGSTTQKGNFVRVISTGAKAIAAGGFHSMVLKQDGTVWTVGGNKYGQLGDGSKKSRTSIFQITIPSFRSGVKAIAAGFLHSMVLEEDGTVWATGRNDHGQLGDGSKISAESFVSVASEAQAVAAGGLHSMILKNDGSFWSTGANNEGQLGDGSTIDKTKFVKVAQTEEATISLDRTRSISCGC